MNKQTEQNEKLGLKELVAMGVGGMVGGGIFSVLGLSVAISGHAAPIAFGLGSIIALLTGFSYTKLGISYHSDGGSFTYLERAFKHKNISGIGGWLLFTGYIGPWPFMHILLVYTAPPCLARLGIVTPCITSWNPLPFSCSLVLIFTESKRLGRARM